MVRFISLRWKISLLLVALSVLFVGSTYAIQMGVVLKGFSQVEFGAAHDNLDRCREAIRRDGEHLANLTTDWAAWDDTYRYMQDRNSGYVGMNLITNTFTINRLNLLLLVRPDGELIWGRLHDLKNGEELKSPELLDRLTRPGHPLMASDEPRSGAVGLVMTEFGLMLIAAHAIVTSKNEGPVHGVLMMGRLLDEAAVQELALRTRVSVQLWPLDSESLTEFDRSARPHLDSDQETYIRDDDPRVLYCYTYLHSVSGEPIALLRADLPRTISRRGVAAAHTATVCSLAGAVVLVGAMWLALRRMVVAPLHRVTEHAVRVGREGDLAARLDLPRCDEIGVLAGEFDRMVKSLAEYRAQLLGTARRAGMAEVATDVLHNVGNVLNSVNVSANLVMERLRQSETPSLAQAAKLIVEHQQDLGRFVNEDERGRHLPGFLVSLAEALAGEQRQLLEEMKSLNQAVDHIKQIVSLQQVHSKFGGMEEEVDPAAILEEAIRLNLDSFDRHNITVERRIQTVGPLLMDRHKTLQILVNLISNAKNSLKESRRADKRLVVELAAVGDSEPERIRLVVEDNGVGIPPEHLSRIFAFGFSTRPDGHGFGLHSAANLAREMSGTLRAESAGPGCGASFTLELPVVRRKVRT